VHKNVFVFVFAKGISKALAKAAKKKNCHLLALWHKSVVKQFCFALASSKGGQIRLVHHLGRASFLGHLATRNICWEQSSREKAME
jgi:hypothetical protein